MKRLLVRIVGVVLVAGALAMLAMFWGDAHSGFSPDYKSRVERDAKDSVALVDALKASNAPAEKVDAAMTQAADKSEELADIYREENRHNEYWQKFYAIIVAAVVLGLVALYFGFRKRRPTTA